MDRLNELIEKLYVDDNYIMIDYPNESETTAIYFSGNAIFYPDTYETAYKRLVEENRFEWLNNNIPTVRRAIFLRDIHKCWYVKGINSRIDSLEKLAEFIDNNSYINDAGEKHCVFVGNSAGGYAATLIGTLLHGDCIFSFAGQNSLWLDGIDNRFVKEKSNEEAVAKYFDLKKIWSDVPVWGKLYYFYSNGNATDKMMYEHIKGEQNVVCIGFDTDTHAETIYSFNYRPLFAMDKKQLERMEIKFAEKVSSRFYFSFYNFGFVFTVKNLVMKALKKTGIAT